MFEWFLALVPVTHAEPPKKDFVGVVAAEVAYAAMLPDTPVTKPLVDTKDCDRCNRTGKIPTGDSNHPWTDCPDCEPKTGLPKLNMKDDGPHPAMKLQLKPLPQPNLHCDESGCQIPSAVSGASKPPVTSRPLGTYRK